MNLTKPKKITFTIFGHKGFIGTYLKNKLKSQNLILPRRNQFIFKKNLGHIIYCIGSDNWKKHPHNSFLANIGYIPEIVTKNKFLTFNYLSSIKVYNKVKNTNENSSLKINPLDKNDYFMIKKICAEAYLLALKRKNIKIIRLSNIYGNNFKSSLALPTFIRESIISKKINITVNKNSLKNYLSINDAINIILKIILRGKKQIYNVAAEKNVKIINIANKIKTLSDCKIILKNQKLTINEPNINIDRIKKEFNFKQKSKILNDIKILLEEFKKFQAYEKIVS